MQNYPTLKLPQPPALPEALKKGEWYLTTSYITSTNSDTEKKPDLQFNIKHSPWSITFHVLIIYSYLKNVHSMRKIQKYIFMDDKPLKKYFGAVPFSVTC